MPENVGLERESTSVAPPLAPAHIPGHIPTHTPADTLAIGAFFSLIILLVEQRNLSELTIVNYLAHLMPTSAQNQSLFRLLMAAPALVAFIFGIIRDRWNPFRLGDRGILLVVCPLVAAVNVTLGFVPFTLTNLIIAQLLSNTGFCLVYAAVQGQMTDVAREQGRSGLLASISQTQIAVGAGIVNFAGGWLAANTQTSTPFFAVAGMSILILWVGLMRSADASNHTTAISKLNWNVLVTFRPLWIAVSIWFLWSISLAQGTPLNDYILIKLHLSPVVLGKVNGIQQLSFFPSILVFAVLCRHFSLKPLLWIGGILGVAQWLPVIFVHTETGAVLWAGLFVGLSGGFATGAFYDLVIRSCPKGYSGVAIMFAWMMVVISQRAFDVPGGWLYDHSGFAACAIVTTLVYVLIFPLLLLIPSEVIRGKDGDHARSITHA